MSVWSGLRLLQYHVARPAKGPKITDTICLMAHQQHDPAVALWIKEHELRYKGRMFDVVLREKRGTELLLYGHYDRRDDYLFSLLDQRPGEPGLPPFFQGKAILPPPVYASGKQLFCNAVHRHHPPGRPFNGYCRAQERPPDAGLCLYCLCTA